MKKEIEFDQLETVANEADEIKVFSTVLLDYYDHFNDIANRTESFDDYKLLGYEVSNSLKKLIHLTNVINYKADYIAEEIEKVISDKQEEI